MIYFFKSSRTREVKTQITIVSKNFLTALEAATRYFKEKGFKGYPVHIIVSFLLLFCVTTAKANPKDTVAVNSDKIERIIEHTTNNSKGKPVTKYYFVYNGMLISTSKNVVEKYKLCKQFGVRIALIMIKNRRITLN